MKTMKTWAMMVFWFVVFVFCEGVSGILMFITWTLDRVESIANKVAAEFMSGWEFRKELVTEF